MSNRAESRRELEDALTAAIGGEPEGIIREITNAQADLTMAMCEDHADAMLVELAVRFNIPVVAIQEAADDFRRRGPVWS